MSAQENKQRFARQHRNNATGKVLAAAVAPLLTPDPSPRRQRSDSKRKGPGNHPGPLLSREIQIAQHHLRAISASALHGPAPANVK
jgi:hypothetical protein